MVQPEKGANWGNVMYEMPDKKYVFFWFKGPYIVGARFDKTELKGIQPKLYRMDLIWDWKNQVHLFALDDERFADLSSFEARLRKLPDHSIIEWQHSDVVITKVPKPLSAKEERKSFEDFCGEAGIILVQYPGG
jgi:hypothetical protein